LKIIEGHHNIINNPHIRCSAIDALSLVNRDIISVKKMGTINVYIPLLKFMKDIDYNKWMDQIYVLKFTDQILQIFRRFNVFNKTDYVFENIDTTISILIKYANSVADELYDILETGVDNNKMSNTIITILNSIIAIINKKISVHKISSDISMQINITYFKIIKFLTKCKTLYTNNISNDMSIIDMFKFHNLHKLWNTTIKTSINELYQCIIMTFVLLIHNSNINVSEIDLPLLKGLVYIENIKPECSAKIIDFITSPVFLHYIKILDNMDELSDQVIDPIFTVPIVEPFMLPDDPTIYDKDHILIAIRDTEKSPITRAKMLVKDVLEYNQKEDIVKKIQDFKTIHSEYFSLLNL